MAQTLEQALNRLTICSNDPVCADHEPGSASMNGYVSAPAVTAACSSPKPAASGATTSSTAPCCSKPWLRTEAAFFESDHARSENVSCCTSMAPEERLCSAGFSTIWMVAPASNHTLRAQPSYSYWLRRSRVPIHEFRTGFPPPPTCTFELAGTMPPVKPLILGETASRD